jgi:hypothetical protein
VNAEREPWNLNETVITEASYQAYKTRAPEAFLPGTFNLNPFGDNIKDHTPIIPTCRSDYLDVVSDPEYHKGSSNLPCSVSPIQVPHLHTYTRDEMGY